MRGLVSLKETKYSIADMSIIAKKNSGKCLSEKYVNNKTKLKWECRLGHTWYAVPASVIRGSWCLDCHLKTLHEQIKK